MAQSVRMEGEYAPVLFAMKVTTATLRERDNLARERGRSSRARAGVSRASVSSSQLTHFLARSFPLPPTVPPSFPLQQMAVLEIMAAATERRQAARDVQTQKSEENLMSAGSWEGGGGKEGGGRGTEGGRERLSDEGLTKLTSAVAMLTSRIEDMVQAQCEIQKAQSGMQKQLSEVQACVKEQNGAAR